MCISLVVKPDKNACEHCQTIYSTLFLTLNLLLFLSYPTNTKTRPDMPLKTSFLEVMIFNRSIVHNVIFSEVLSPISKPFTYSNIAAEAFYTNTLYLNVSLHSFQAHLPSHISSNVFKSPLYNTEHPFSAPNSHP